MSVVVVLLAYRRCFTVDPVSQQFSQMLILVYSRFSSGLVLCCYSLSSLSCADPGLVQV